MPLWEFREFLRSVERDQAIFNLTQLQCGRLTFGGLEKRDAEQVIGAWKKTLQDEPRLKEKPKQRNPKAVFAKLSRFMRGA